ncbi:MAG: fasciclin domain-containing protein, partial [Methanoculleus sp.]
YHVVQGKLTARELAGMEAIRTLQGDHLDIASSSEGVLVNEATIIQPDIECTDGIYHIIDRVLIPRAVNARVTRSV